jgi:hypothetical protein
MAITQEDCIAAHRVEKKRKASIGPAISQSPRYRLVPSNVPRAPPRGNLPGRWVARPPQQVQINRPPLPQIQQQPQQDLRPSFPPATPGNNNSFVVSCECIFCLANRKTQRNSSIKDLCARVFVISCECIFCLAKIVTIHRKIQK